MPRMDVAERAHDVFKLPLATTIRIPNTVRVRQDDEFLGYMRDEALYRLETEVWCERLQDETVTLKASAVEDVRVPSTWWQHFKRDCFPLWLLRKFPVHHVSIHVTVSAEKTYRFQTIAKLPEFRYESPKGTHRIYTMVATIQ